jgi:hypothetical protein
MAVLFAPARTISKTKVGATNWLLGLVIAALSYESSCLADCRKMLAWHYDLLRGFTPIILAVDLSNIKVSTMSREVILSIILAYRRGARVDDWGGLENRCGFRPTVGSNPTLSAGHKNPLVTKVTHYRRLQSVW